MTFDLRAFSLPAGSLPIQADFPLSLRAFWAENACVINLLPRLSLKIKLFITRRRRREEDDVMLLRWRPGCQDARTPGYHCSGVSGYQDAGIAEWQHGTAERHDTTMPCSALYSYQHRSGRGRPSKASAAVAHMFHSCWCLSAGYFMGLPERQAACWGKKVADNNKLFSIRFGRDSGTRRCVWGWQESGNLRSKVKC